MMRLWLVILLLATMLLSACAIEPEDDGALGNGIESAGVDARFVPGHAHRMAPLEEMPAEVQSAGARTQEAYRFAVDNPDAARSIPCYCGCVGLGHTSSYDCYVAGMSADGAPEFDLHAANCTVCVDITHDQMRMIDLGKSPATIRDAIDATYAKYGPPTE